jgi:hypothetical protein
MNEILVMENLAVGFDNVRPFIKRAEPLKFDEAEFLSKQFGDAINIQELGFDPDITSYLQRRVDEAQSCPKNKVPLGTIFLLGSTLEGILLAVALKDQAK